MALNGLRKGTNQNKQSALLEANSRKAINDPENLNFEDLRKKIR